MDASSSTLGLVVNFVIQITAQLNGLVHAMAGLEADITSVERIWEFASNKQEYDGAKGTQPLSTWPQSPSIEFDSFTACYNPGDALCLNDISLRIEAGQHVAVVGRTGAGKSSFANAVLGVLDARAIISGHIRIGDHDISQVSLTSLRKAITFVPQEPAVFTGTLRHNLDPEGNCSDMELLEVAKSCHIRQVFNMSRNTDLLEFKIFNDRYLQSLFFRVVTLFVKVSGNHASS